MTKKEILEKLEKLETEKFYLDMKDHWEGSDYLRAASLTTEIHTLKKKLKEMEE